LESWFRSFLLLARARALVPSVGGFLRTQRQKRKKEREEIAKDLRGRATFPPWAGALFLFCVFFFFLFFFFFFLVVGWGACALLVVVVVVVDGRCCCCWSEESFMLFLVSICLSVSLSVLPYLTLPSVFCVCRQSHTLQQHQQQLLSLSSAPLF